MRDEDRIIEIEYAKGPKIRTNSTTTRGWADRTGLDFNVDIVNRQKRVKFASADNNRQCRVKFALSWTPAACRRVVEAEESIRGVTNGGELFIKHGVRWKSSPWWRVYREVGYRAPRTMDCIEG